MEITIHVIGILTFHKKPPLPFDTFFLEEIELGLAALVDWVAIWTEV